MARRPLSLQARSLLAAGIVLAAFLGLTGFALDQAIYQTLLSTLHDRLQGYAYGFLATSDVSRSRRWIPPEVEPEPRLESPGSGLYAGVVGPVEVDGARFDSWRSPSALVVNLPFDEKLKPGVSEFDGPLDGAGGKIYKYSIGVTVWDAANRGSVDLTLHVAETAANLQAQRDVFRRSLLIYFGGLGIALLLLLLGLLRWSLQPLRRIVTELGRVERGEQEQLSADYPLELKRFAGSINDFIGSERDSLKRYRNTLSDLAHSLKTPLAVVRSQLESGADGKDFRWTVLEQIGRMDQIVAYQLSRAATSGHTTFAAPIRVEPYAEEVVASLEKVYSSKNILCEFEIDADAQFYGDQGDLLELLGNLLENAFKWAVHHVELSARVLPGAGTRRNGLELVVEDDGPGIPEDRIAHLLQRGVRGDERVQGHGIGLAIVQDLLKAYRGDLSVTRSENLGGAAFTVRFAAG
ncbi:MAG TPA: ATP-binding protein [Rudaea sp.]|jgi:two-component system sensor histidine kinase PhoQ|uniref:ATP-binding protein n=1 Tax=Rudaea sp. TaxID=2136325 RepID=UPI002F9438BF